MNQDVSLFKSVLDTMPDNEKIKEQKSSVEKIAWEVNQHLAPGTLANMSSRSLKSLYIKVVMRYLQAKETVGEVKNIHVKTDALQNKAIGGAWI